MEDFFEDGLFAAIAAIGFSSISNTPRRAYLYCGLTAAIGHSVRFLLMSDCMALNIVVATAIASLLIGFVGVLFAPRIKCPAEVCIYPALLPLIPGMYAYRTIVAMVKCMSQTSEEIFNHYLYLLSYNGLIAVAVVLAMVVAANMPIFILKKIAFQATR